VVGCSAFLTAWLIFFKFSWEKSIFRMATPFGLVEEGRILPNFVIYYLKKLKI
jgi:hypothetical protein